MSAETALKHARTNWEKVIARVESIEIPELGAPDKPMKCEYRVFSGKEQAELTSYATVQTNEGIKFDTFSHNTAIIIQALRNPKMAGGEKIFNFEEHFEELLSLDWKWQKRVAGEILLGQDGLKASAEEVKNSSAPEAPAQD